MQRGEHPSAGGVEGGGDLAQLLGAWLRHWSDQCAALAGAAGGTVVRDERYVLTDYGRPASFFNAAVLLAPQPAPGDLDALLDDERLRFWTTTTGDGSPAAISAQFVSRGVAGFALSVTLPTARRGGHWSRHARLRLHTEPGRWHVGVFSDDSRPGAERLGFVPVLVTTTEDLTTHTTDAASPPSSWPRAPGPPSATPANGSSSRPSPAS